MGREETPPPDRKDDSLSKTIEVSADVHALVDTTFALLDPKGLTDHMCTDLLEDRLRKINAMVKRVMDHVTGASE